MRGRTGTEGPGRGGLGERPREGAGPPARGKNNISV